MTPHRLQTGAETGPQTGPQIKAETGAALFAVLAMIMLLATFATLGLERLRAATDRAVDGDARAEADLMASAAAALGRTLASQQRGLPANQANALARPITVPLAPGSITLSFADAGSCFNLNSLMTTAPGTAPQASWQDFARLLAATGLSGFEAETLARATAASLSARSSLLVDPSEWLSVRGVTPKLLANAAAVLCTLPSREVAPFNINGLTADKAPLLIALGLSPDEARRALAARPQNGWASSGDFWSQGAPGSQPSERASTAIGTSSRWLHLRIVARTPRIAVGRELLLDTLETPARVASSLWVAVPQPEANAG